MPLELPTPILYQISSGKATNQTLATDAERLLAEVAIAIAANLPLYQIREKNLTARALYELSRSAVESAAGSQTRILINDYAGIAIAAGAAGVHLTTRSMDTAVVRRNFGENFLIGVSTHTIEEARHARDGGADFAVIGPVFSAPAKTGYGKPMGLEGLRAIAGELAPFPLLALGGVTAANAASAIDAGASGVAAIRAFRSADRVDEMIRSLRGTRS
jgi:thiamine-phosphate pyrophosphorylase